MPMELNNMSLKEICDKLLPLFYINYNFENSVATAINKKFEKTNFDYDKAIKQLIVDLATERGIYVNHTANGELRFTDSSASNLKIQEHYEDYGLLDASLEINGQAMHSHISVLAPTSDSNLVEGEYTIVNPYVIGKTRPIIYKLQTGDSFDVQTYARMKLASELRNISLSITTTKFVKPGKLITVKSDKLKLKKRVTFFVEQTDIKSDAKSLIYTMKCVLKDVYTKTEVRNELR
jgi:prophage tail gpP-like protein